MCTEVMSEFQNISVHTRYYIFLQSRVRRRSRPEQSHRRRQRERAQQVALAGLPDADPPAVRPRGALVWGRRHPQAVGHDGGSLHPQPPLLAAPARVVAGARRRPQPAADGGTRADGGRVRGALPPVVPRLRQRRRPAKAGAGGGVRRLRAGGLSARRRGRAPRHAVRRDGLGEGRLRQAGFERAARGGDPGAGQPRVPLGLLPDLQDPHQGVASVRRHTRGGQGNLPEYPGASAPPAYISVPSAAGHHQVTMATPYPAYPPPAYSSQAYLPSSAPTYLPASYAAAPLQHHLPYGTVSVAPNLTAYGVPPTYLTQLPQVYSARPGTVYVPAAAYDASARFDGHAMPIVPPPPPGVAPNAAQLAMMQGNPVVLSQQKNSFVTGGSGGGFTFW